MMVKSGKGGFSVDVNGRNLPENFVLTARCEEIEWVHSNKVYENVPMQECNDAGRKLLDLIWVDTNKSVDPAHKKNRSTLCAKEYKTKKQVKIQGAFSCFSVVHCIAAT